MLGIYCRISRHKGEGKDRSIHDQKMLGLELAKKLNLNSKVFIEEGISGTLPIDKRPQLEKLLQEIEDGLITHMFIYMQDRLERNPEVRFYIKRILKDANARLFTEKGEIDLHDDDSDLLGDIQSLFNAQMVRKTKKRVKSVLKRNAEEQRPHGITPYGYKVENRKYVPSDYEADVVKRIYNYCVDGWSTGEIAKQLNSEKIKSRKGLNWLASSVYYLLKNPRYKGERPYKSANNGFVPIAPIVDHITWEKAQLSLKNNRLYSGAPQTHNYLLKGILRCNVCGMSYHGVVSKKNNYYSCISNTKPHLKDKCDNSGISITKLDTLIWDRLFMDKVLIKRLKKALSDVSQNKVESNLKNQLLEVKNQLQENEKKFSNIRRLAVEGLFSTDELRPEIAKIKKEKTKLEIELSNINEELLAISKNIYNADDAIKELINLKSNLPFKYKKTLVNKYIKEIRVNNEFKSIRLHEIEIYFNIPNIEDEVYLVPYKMHFAIEIFEEILIPISDKFKKMSEEDRIKIGVEVSRQIKSVFKKK